MIQDLPKSVARQDDLPQKLDWKGAASTNAQGGDAGVDFFFDTLPHPGVWGSFQAIGATVVAAATFTPSSGSLAGHAIASGERIFGPLKSIQLTSGGVACYRAAAE